MNYVKHFDIDGAKFPFLDPGNSVGKGTVPGFHYENGIMELLRDAVREADTFCDIGALHGYFGCLAASFAPHVIVHSFEPNPMAASVATQNLRANNVRGFVHNIALNADGTDMHFLGRSLLEKAQEGSVIVPGATFDQFASRVGIRNAVVKVDVHGAEGFVLEGMKNSLKERVSALFLEVHPRRQIVGECDYDRFLRIVEDAGMSLYEVVEFRDRHRAELMPLVNDARREFVSGESWKPEHEQFQRMIFASREK